MLLNNALRQTGWTGGTLDEATWRLAVAARLREANWAQAVADVRPFLEPGVDVSLLAPENLAQVLAGKDKGKPAGQE